MACDKKYLDMMNQWLILKQEGKSIGNYLEQQGYHTVAVYGMAIYGRHIIRELQGTSIAIAYGIDSKKMNAYRGIEILQPVGELPYAEVIINSVIHDHTNIKNTLENITDIPVLCLEDIIFDSYDCGN